MEKFVNITLYNADCMDVMKCFADNQFDLAIAISKYNCIFVKNIIYDTRFKTITNW